VFQLLRDANFLKTSIKAIKQQSFDLDAKPEIICLCDGGLSKKAN
jgi:hypothetical protein